MFDLKDLGISNFSSSDLATAFEGMLIDYIGKEQKKVGKKIYFMLHERTGCMFIKKSIYKQGEIQSIGSLGLRSFLVSIIGKNQLMAIKPILKLNGINFDDVVSKIEIGLIIYFQNKYNETGKNTNIIFLVDNGILHIFNCLSDSSNNIEYSLKNAIEKIDLNNISNLINNNKN